MNSKEKLYEAATKMLDTAYVPYSHFPVGAAALTKDGEIFAGCNIENSSYPVTNCGERTALFKAISEGYTEFDSFLVTGHTEEPISPCGACRQVMSEWFDEKTTIYLTNQSGDEVEVTMETLLPGAFKKEDMK